MIINMNSALLIIGCLRTFELCIQNYEDIIQKFNPDIFLCISDTEFNLHPFNKKLHNFYHDRVLPIELIKIKLGISTLFESKIKGLIIVSDKEEENFITSHFDKNMNNKFVGLDLLKQYNKFNLGLNEIEKYTTANNKTYDYIVKSRTDLLTDINTLPTYPLDNNTIFSASPQCNGINDVIFVSSEISNFRKITQGVLDFLTNNYILDTNEDVNINNILKSIYEKHSLPRVENIQCKINHDYHLLFNTTISLVTCFYNIGRENWRGFERSVDKYFSNCETIMKQLYPLFIFTTEEYKDRCIQIRKKTDPYLIYTKVIIIPFENLAYYDKYDMIHKIQKSNINNIANSSGLEPEFTVPEYVILINNKVHFIEIASKYNIYKSNIFQWVDFGIHANIISPSCSNRLFDEIIYKKNKVRIAGFNLQREIHDKLVYYNSHDMTLNAGLISADVNSINILTKLFDEEFNNCLNMGVINQEQYILYYLLCKNPELFDYYVATCWDTVGCTFFKKSNIKVALCMSGHLRSYEFCRKNIQEKIIQPLKMMGIHTDMFLSSWNDIGYRSDNFCTSKIEEDNVNFLEDFTKYEFENYDSQYFIENFSTNKYLEYSNLSSKSTCPDAASALYKYSKVFNLMVKYAESNNILYDIVIRIRPDIFYDYNIELSLLQSVLFNDTNCIYMPSSHMKYTTVTKNIMDHYFLGNINNMKIAMNTFEYIKNMIAENDCPHTCEGFIWKHLINNNINVERFTLFYSSIRKNNICEKVF